MHNNGHPGARSNYFKIFVCSITMSCCEIDYRKQVLTNIFIKFMNKLCNENFVDFMLKVGSTLYNNNRVGLVLGFAWFLVPFVPKN
jgi:hypothetical protein